MIQTKSLAIFLSVAFSFQRSVEASLSFLVLTTRYVPTDGVSEGLKNKPRNQSSVHHAFFQSVFFAQNQMV